MAIKKKVKIKQVCSYGHNTSVIPMIPKDELLPEYECKFCGHIWIPRTNKPSECPNCRRRNWQRKTKEED